MIASSALLFALALLGAPLHEGHAPSSQPASGGAASQPAAPSAPLLGPREGDPCADVFDQTEECEAPENLPLVGLGEPYFPPEYDETPETVDSSLVAASLFGTGAVVAAATLGVVVGSVLYGIYSANQARERTISPDDLAAVGRMQLLIQGTAVALGLTAALFAGAGGSLLVFDPMTGGLQPAFRDEG